MRTLMTSQQSAFFTQNGFLEIEGLNFDPDTLFSAAKRAASVQPFGRDLWRKEETLRHLLLRKLAPAIFSLTAAPVRLACDQWMPLLPQSKACSAKELVSIQGLILCAIFTAAQVPPPVRRKSALGIPPFSKGPGNVLFVKPHIILDWPLLANSPVDLYMAAWALPNNAVYICNPKDPAVHALKELGYAFGDRLADPHHPLLLQS